MRANLAQEKQRVISALEGLLREIEAEQKALEQSQAKLEGLTPMRVVWKGKSCGKEHCRCQQGLRHGPYPYLIEQKEGKRLERYLGTNWSPPEGMVAPERFRHLMKELRTHRTRLEALLERLDKAARVLMGAEG